MVSQKFCCCLIKGEKKQKTKTNKKKQNTTKYPKFKCNTVSVSQHEVVVQSLSYQREREGKKERKKEPADSSVNGYLGLGLTCPLLSACCCWRRELSTHPATGWGSVCPGGCADLAQGRLWGTRVPLSSPGGPRLSGG
jgi:hypothetical protein